MGGTTYTEQEKKANSEIGLTETKEESHAETKVEAGHSTDLDAAELSTEEQEGQAQDADDAKEA